MAKFRWAKIPMPTRLDPNEFKLCRVTQESQGDVVLDPFVGSGTTCVAALKTKRHYIGYDTNKEYCKLAERRIESSLQEQISLFESKK